MIDDSAHKPIPSDVHESAAAQADPADVPYNPEEQAIIDRFLALPRRCRREIERTVEKKLTTHWETMREHIAACEIGGAFHKH